MSYFMFGGKRVISYFLVSCCHSFCLKSYISAPFGHCNARTLYLYIAAFKIRYFFYLRLGKEVDRV